MARSGASACLIKEDGNKKINVFGGVAADDSSNWVEVFDLETATWELLSVSTPKNNMPLKIQQSMVMEDRKRVYTVDEDGEIFIFSTSECAFWTGGEKESDPENKNDWRLFGQVFLCRGIGGRILWRGLSESDWKEVKGLEEELRGVDIIKICPFSPQRIAIFWLRGPAYQTLQLWFAEISLEMTKRQEVWGFWGNIESSGPVLSDSSYTGLNLLFADSLYL
ncbi:Galactose oxidase/kelch repeat superfamily protein [Raphanus sativus]|nr:Galactose oxidase/kelch repeat superfamily protein [Raphanus sativus]